MVGVASKSETSCTKGSVGDTGSGGMSTNDEMPPTRGDSEVVDETVVVKCDRKVLSDGGTSNPGRKTACRPSQREQGCEW